MAPGLLPGHVTLDAGADWFAERWPGVPAARGLDAAGILRAAAEGKVDTLILLGADPIADFPDRDLAERGLAGARNGDRHRPVPERVGEAGRRDPAGGGLRRGGGHDHQPRGPGQHADPQGDAARHRPARLGDRRRPGLPPRRTTWASSRPSRSGRRSRPWPRASPASRSTWSTGRGPRRRAGAAAPPGLRLRRQAGRGRGPVRGRHGTSRSTTPRPTRPRPTSARARTRRSTPPASPARATPRWAASPSARPRPPATSPATTAREATSPPPRWRRPPRCRCPPGPTGTPAPLDAYSLRLVATRKLYDRGTLVRHSPSMADLAEAADLRLQPRGVREAGRLARRQGAGHLQPGAPHRAGPARHRRAAARGPAQRQRPRRPGQRAHRRRRPGHRRASGASLVAVTLASTRSSTAASACPTSSSSCSRRWWRSSCC